jgi:hypothetical protein
MRLLLRQDAADEGGWCGAAVASLDLKCYCFNALADEALQAVSSHSAQRYRLVCTEAQVVVAVHAAGDAAGTTLRQLSFTASSPRTPACAPTRTRYTELTATHNGLPVQPYGRLLSLTRFLPRGAGRRGG